VSTKIYCDCCEKEIPETFYYRINLTSVKYMLALDTSAREYCIDCVVINKQIEANND